MPKLDCLFLVSCFFSFLEIGGHRKGEMASKRIQKELKDLQKDPPTSCSAGPTAFFLACSSVDFCILSHTPVCVGVRFVHMLLNRPLSHPHMLACFGRSRTVPANF